MVLLLTLLASSWVHAEDLAAGKEPVASEAPQVDEASQVGSATSALLVLQREGTASRNRLPMLGDEATAAYTRYLDSFTHKIPAYFSSSVTSGGENANQQGSSY
ncbi:DUF3613 domain-containing protein [Neisseriaceae bacterium JH1-16]|nr:DUF3613 domain-containing protein [Neisseriaceae bacterium JH1-16]